MKYFIDFEFDDNGKSIEPFWIGIVTEDSRQYDAVIADADWERIHKNDWLTENVIPKLPPQSEWKSKEQIKEELLTFLTYKNQKPELWGWYAAWDFICLARILGPQLLGMDEQIPQYIHDVRALLDFARERRYHIPPLPPRTDIHNPISDALWTQHVEKSIRYPEYWEDQAKLIRRKRGSWQPSIKM